jgi:hypothetical protein
LLGSQANLGSSENAGLELTVSDTLPRKIVYSLTFNPYANRIDANNVPGGRVQSAWTASVRGNITWTPTERDVIQINGNGVGSTIAAQGRKSAYGVLNLGYRRKLSDKISALFQVNDLLDTLRLSSRTETPFLRSISLTHSNSRTFFLGLIYAFGAAKTRPTTFDFNQVQ